MMTAAYRWVGALVLLASAGCDPLLVEPGADFSLEVLSPASIQLDQQLSPVSISFRVTGCEPVEMAVGQRTTGGTNDRVVSFVPEGDHFRMEVPAHWLVEASGCWPTDGGSDGTFVDLVAECESDQRRVRVSLPLTWRPASAVVWQARGLAEHLFDGGEAGQFFVAGAGWLTLYQGTEEIGEDTAVIAAGAKPVLGRRDHRVYLWAGCPLPSCGLVPVYEGPELQFYTLGGYIYSAEVSTATSSLFFDADPAQLVPGRVRDLAIDTLGQLHVLTDVGGAATLVIADDQVVAQHVWKDVWASPHLVPLADGRLAFLVFPEEGASAMAVTTTGETLWRSATIPHAGSVTTCSLAPDGEHYGIVEDGTPWLGFRDQWLTRIQIDLLQGDERQNHGVAWPEGRVAVWSESRVEVFARTQDHERVFDHPLAVLAPEGWTPWLMGVNAVEDRLILSTYTGVRVLDENGALMGGLDPLPCWTGPVTGPARIFSDGRVGIAFGQDIYLLDTSTMVSPPVGNR